MNGSSSTSPPERRLRGPGRLGKTLTAVVVAVLVVIAGFGLFEYVESGFTAPLLVIYTYPSLLNGTDCGSPVLTSLLNEFAGEAGIAADRISLVCPSGTLVSTLLAQANAPAADVVVGLDEITAPEAEAHHLLRPYAPSDLGGVPSYLVSELSPDDGAVPYEYGFLGIDFSAWFDNLTAGAVEHATLRDIANNSTWAQQLLTENPAFDITGEEFLVWQVLYYEQILHENWQDFWTAHGGSFPTPAPDWGTAFGEFMDAAHQHQMVVSYTTDPAYAAWYGEAGAFNSTVAWWNGTQYGWRTIYGVGIVNGTRHLSLAEQFENFFLSAAVQSEIPLNEWEYPAVTTTPLPAVFADAPDPGVIVALNNDTTPAQVSSALPGWINEWLALNVGNG